MGPPAICNVTRVAKVMMVQGHVLSGPGRVLAEGQVIGDCFYVPDFWPPLTDDPLAAGTRNMVNMDHLPAA